MWIWATCCLCVCAHFCQSLRPCGLYPSRLLCPWNFPDKCTGVGCYFLLQGIFLTQGLNLCLLLLLHWQENSWPLVISEISGLYDWTLSSHIKALKRKQRSLEGEETLSPDYLWISNLLAYTDTRILARLHNRGNQFLRTDLSIYLSSLSIVFASLETSDWWDVP